MKGGKIPSVSFSNAFVGKMRHRFIKQTPTEQQSCNYYCAHNVHSAFGPVQCHDQRKRVRTKKQKKQQHAVSSLRIKNKPQRVTSTRTRVGGVLTLKMPPFRRPPPSSLIGAQGRQPTFIHPPPPGAPLLKRPPQLG